MFEALTDKELATLLAQISDGLKRIYDANWSEGPKVERWITWSHETTWLVVELEGVQASRKWS